MTDHGIVTQDDESSRVALHVGTISGRVIKSPHEPFRDIRRERERERGEKRRRQLPTGRPVMLTRAYTHANLPNKRLGIRLLQNET